MQYQMLGRIRRASVPARFSDRYINNCSHLQFIKYIGSVHIFSTLLLVFLCSHSLRLSSPKSTAQAINQIVLYQLSNETKTVINLG